MSNHISEWLNAYHDGELHGNRLHSVEAHLAECDLCQAELESLEELSTLLHEVPTPESIPVERLAAQVNLRLPHQQIKASRKQILEIGWWMIPVALVTIWIFFNTVFIVRDLVITANHLGWLNAVSTVPLLNSSSEPYWSASLGQFGLLSGRSLNVAEATEAFTRNHLPFISVQVSIALLYLSWIAIWWARRQRQGHGPLLEG
jgi:predicted anti-sigma-YlaC factor YlaD